MIDSKARWKSQSNNDLYVSGRAKGAGEESEGCDCAIELEVGSGCLKFGYGTQPERYESH